MDFLAEVGNTDLQIQFSQGALDRDFPEGSDAENDVIVLGAAENVVPTMGQAWIVAAPSEQHVRIEKIPHELRHVFAHFFERLSKVFRNPNLALHVPASPFTAFERCGFEFGHGFAALGDDE